MPKIAQVAGVLCAAPKPVICLDTCDILEVVQCLDWEKPGIPRTNACIQPVRRLLYTLTANPDRAQVIKTDLVHLEWNQNIAAIRTKAEEFITKIDDIVGLPYGGLRHSLALYCPFIRPWRVARLLPNLSLYQLRS